MSRRFDGSNDEVRYPVQAVSNFTGAFTVGAIVRRRNVGTIWQALLQHIGSNGTTDAITFEWDNGNPNLLASFINGSDAYRLTGITWNTNDWIFVALTKPSGTTQVTIHYRNLTTGAAWVHTTGGTARGNATNHAGGSIRVGEWLDSDDANMNLAVDFGWAVVLSNPQIEGLVANNRTQDFLDLHSTVPGAYCHQHNQATATEDIVDLFGNGHTATGTITGTTDTSGIEGTAIETGTNLDPPSWTYYSGSDTTPPVVNVTSSATAKISDETGKSSYDYAFRADEDCQAWQIRVVANAGDAHTTGTLIENGGSISANTTINGSITYDELNAAGQGGEGSKILKFFAQDIAGNWSI